MDTISDIITVPHPERHACSDDEDNCSNKLIERIFTTETAKEASNTARVSKSSWLIGLDKTHIDFC